MAKKDQPNLFEKHVEKLALGAAAIVLLVVLFGWVAHSPNTGQVTSMEPTPPDKLDAEILRIAQEVERTIQREQPKVVPVPDRLKSVLETLATPLSSEPQRPLPSNRLIVSPAIGVPDPSLTGGEVSVNGPTVERMPIAPPLGPTQTWAGWETVEWSSQALADTPIVHLTTVLDYKAMVNDWKPLLRSVGMSATNAVMFARVTAVREERLPGGSWGKQRVLTAEQQVFDMTNPAAPRTRPDLLRTDQVAVPIVPVMPANVPQEQKRQYVTDMRAMIAGFGSPGVQSAILEPAAYNILWDNIGLGTWRRRLPRTPVNDTEAAQLDPTLTSGAPTVTESPAFVPPSRPGRAIRPEDYEPMDDYSAGPTPVRGVRPVAPVVAGPALSEQIVPVPPLGNQCKDGLIQVWAHDVSAECEKEYRYRLQVEVFNPLFGQFGLVKDPRDAERVTLASVSEWSQPITIQPAVRFYLAGIVQPPTGGVAPRGSSGLRVDVFRNTMGQSLRHTFVVNAGEPIGEKAILKYVNPLTRNAEDREFDLSTGAVLVSFEGTQASGAMGTRPIAEAVVLNQAGQLEQRNEDRDKNDAQYKRLSDDARKTQENIRQLLITAAAATP